MRNKNILVIEDDIDIRNALKDILELENYHVTLAADGKEGLERLGAHGKFDLILLDMMMPVMNGWDFLDRMRDTSAWSEIPVIAVSAAHVGTAGAQVAAFLKKPLDLAELLDTIQRLCD